MVQQSPPNSGRQRHALPLASIGQRSDLKRAALIATLVPLLFALVPTVSLCAQNPNAGVQEPRQQTPEQPPLSLADAEDLYRQGAYGRAIDAYEKLAKTESNAVLAVVGLARCRWQIGQYDQALQDLHSVDGANSDVWHIMMADLLDLKGLYQQALQHARAASDLAKSEATPRLRLAQLLEKLGRRDDAIDAYRWFDRQLVERDELPADAAWMTAAAVGFVRYSVLTRTNVADRTRHALNRMLQPAYERLDRTYWPARIAAADLLRERFNNDTEDGSLSDYEASLRINENLPQAQVGIGEVMLASWNFEEVERCAGLALAVNPSYPPAFHLLGKKCLVERKYDNAFEQAGKALAINRNDITALAIQAAARACQFNDTAVASLTKTVKSLQPEPSEFYRILGDALGGIRQYAASEQAYNQAIDMDPTDANARTELGMMYMQWGLEDKARATLEAAWALDPFNERTKFTLELVDELDNFDHIDTDHFVVKYDANKDPGIGTLAADYMESIYDLVTGDYDTPIPGKTTIEVFPTRRAFGVRITGKPWIHTIGAATGRVIALASQRDSAHMAPYNMAHVLLHEFTHTVTLEATRNRIPHWFTEGLAVLQEESPRPFEWTIALGEAIRHDRLFTLESIDWGFIRPQHPGDRQLAYAQSEWMCQYMIERFTYDAIGKLLACYHDGKTQTEAFADVLHVSPTEFHAGFLSWAQNQAASWGIDLSKPEDPADLRIAMEKDPDNAQLWGRVAKAELDAGHYDRALEAARKTLQLDENNTRALTVFTQILADAAHKEPDRQRRDALDEKAIPALDRLLERDPKSWIAPKYRAEIALRQHDNDLAFELYQRLQRVCPRDPASWKGLAGIYLIRNELGLALPQLRELVRIAPDDAEAASQLGAINRRRKNLREAQYWYQQAVYVDPFNVGYRKDLGNVLMQAGNPQAAFQQYDVLTRIEPSKLEHLESAALAAHKAGLDDKAREFAGRAVAIDPSTSVQSILR